jgi:hypothetical protein
MKRFVSGGVIPALILVAIGACAPTYVWKSRPPVQKVETSLYRATFEPVKVGAVFYSFFRLEVVNSSEKEIELDWNRSLYLFNGKPDGLFVFAGIRPEDLKEKRIPPDIIPAGGTLTKEVAPERLIAIAPYREKSVGVTSEGISAGRIPDGESGIFLVVRQDGQELAKKLLVTISAVQQQ